MDLKSNPQQIKSVRPDLNLKESYNLPVCFFLFFFLLLLLCYIYYLKLNIKRILHIIEQQMVRNINILVLKAFRQQLLITQVNTLK
jgi:hypothetical protein